MSHLIFDKRDWNFILNEQLKVEQMLEWPSFADFDTDTFQAIIDEGVKFAVDRMASINEIGDREGTKVVDGQVRVPEPFKAVYKEHTEAGWLALCHNPEFGGQGVPLTVAAPVSEASSAAAMAFSMYGGLTHSAGHLIEAFGTDELKKLYVEKMYSGEWGGTMGLTEPGAGSEVGDLRTKAIRQDDDSFLIQGNKIFISGGDHDMVDNIVHLVLARIEGDPAGTKGITLFAVPKYLVNKDGSVGEFNNVQCVGVEHKMGINGSATCQLSFGEDGPCRGWVVGLERQGIANMFQMMNEARIACGQQGVALANAAYQRALDYARGRSQGPDMTNPRAGSVPIINHPDVRRNLLLMRAYAEGTRALVAQSYFWQDEANHAPTPEQRAAAQDRLELVTPITKAYSTDKGFKVCETAVQVYGGYGFLQDYPVEQYLRDIKITSIYEGTNGIQALDLLGRKLRMKGGALFMGYLQDLGAFIAANKGREEIADVLESLERAQGAIGQTAMWLAGTGQQDIKLALLQATPFLECVGDVMVGHQLAQQAVIAADALRAKHGSLDVTEEDADRDSDLQFYAAKIGTARFFASEVLRMTPSKAKALTSGNRVALDFVF